MSIVVMQVWTVLLLIAQSVLSCMLAWSCFCRLQKMNESTIREVRMAFWFQAVSALVVLGAPVLPLLVPECDWTPWTTPPAVWVMLLLASVAVLISSARNWRHGIPSAFNEQ